MFITGGTGEMKIRQSAPGDATGMAGIVGEDQGVAYSNLAFEDAFSTAPTAYNTINSSQWRNVSLETVVTTTTGGTWVVQWAQNVSNATASTVVAGSYFMYQEL